MIDFFQDWIPQIVSYAEMVSDGRLRRAWKGEEGLTSAYYSGELDEQIFGDLHADQFMVELAERLHDNPALADALTTFLVSLRPLISKVETSVDVDVWSRGRTIPADVSNIFAWQEWLEVEASASTLLHVYLTSPAREIGLRGS